MAGDQPRVQAHVVSRRAGREVSIDGWLGTGTDASVRDDLHDIIATGEGDLIVRLGNADVGDATGLGVLLGAHVRARRAGRRLVLADVSSRTSRMLTRTRWGQVLQAPAAAPAA